MTKTGEGNCDGEAFSASAPLNRFFVHFISAAREWRTRGHRGCTPERCSPVRFIHHNHARAAYFLSRSRSLSPFLHPSQLVVHRSVFLCLCVCVTIFFCMMIL